MVSGKYILKGKGRPMSSAELKQLQDDIKFAKEQIKKESKIEPSILKANINL